MIAAGLVVAGCTAGDSTDSGDSATATTQAGPTATGPAPGVTDDAVDIGVTYVDAAALEAVGLTYDLGDYEAVYQALFDAINAEGGIHGRELRPVLAPVDPATQQSVDEACVQLTEDADVFLVIGFFLTDAVLCPVATHETAVLGGEMTTERVDQAQAPWLTWTPDGDQPEAVLRALDEAGELDGRVAVYANARDEAQVDDLVVPTLEELGVDVVEVGIETGDDIPAQEAANQTISERFQAAGADTLVLVGQSGQDWPSFRETDTSYRPQLLFLDGQALNSFTSNEGSTDLSVVDGSLAGGGYGPDQARYDEAEMQACLGVLADAGVDVPAPEDVAADPSNQPYQAAFQACADLAVLRAWFEAAGEDLNYGTLAAATEGLEVSVPGDPTSRTFGPPPDADGNPAAYLFEWDGEELVPLDG